MKNEEVQTCHRCGNPLSLMGGGWMCINPNCSYYAILIHDIPDFEDGALTWTDEFDMSADSDLPNAS